MALFGGARETNYGATSSYDETETVEDTVPSASSDCSVSVKQETTCEVCTDAPSKYTCPGCGVKTCCVGCVKEHKVKLDCTGHRNKFAWMDKSQYSDVNLLNDYRFLENAERTVYSNKTVPKNNRRQHNGPHPYQHQSRRTKLLMQAANKRGIRLRIMSDHMQKHKSNTSFYTIKTDTIEWHIEWHFVTANCMLKDERVPETSIVMDIAKKYGNAVDYPHLRKTLDDYRKKFQHCRYLIKMDGLPANRNRYFQLKPSSSIADNLKGLSVVEHPTIYVLPPSYSGDDYVLLDKDDLAHMHQVPMRHLTRTHPDFMETECLEQQLLNPSSGVYTATVEEVPWGSGAATTTTSSSSINRNNPVIVI